MTRCSSYPKRSADPSLQTPALISSARALAKAAAHPEVVAALEEFDNRLAYRTFLVGHDIGSTDFVLWAALKSEHLIHLAIETDRFPQPISRRLDFQRVANTLTYSVCLPTSTPFPPLKMLSVPSLNRNPKQDRRTRPLLPSPSDSKAQRRVRS